MNIYNHVIYVIEPRVEFADWLSGRVSLDVVKVLQEPVIYHSQEKDDSTWLESDRLLKAKLSFLVTLRHGHHPPLLTDAEFAALFGSLQMTASLFDRWWTIRRHQATRELGLSERLLAHTTEPAAPTGSP